MFFFFYVRQPAVVGATDLPAAAGFISDCCVIYCSRNHKVNAALFCLWRAALNWQLPGDFSREFSNMFQEQRKGHGWEET